jgi:MFS family permease
MTQQRWLRIIPVALVMYTISYMDRTNVSLALDPEISSMMKDLFMDDRMKGEAAGIFFLGYFLLQIPGGHWASRWSARKIVSIFLVAWGLFAAGCGLSRSFRQFEMMRFMLGVAESGVFPATLVLLANWFPRAERARANAYWMLCQPLAIVASAPLTAWLLGSYGWKRMMILEGVMPFVWLPLWWFCIRDHPREAKWLPAEERQFLETTLAKEAAELEATQGTVADLSSARQEDAEKAAGEASALQLLRVLGNPVLLLLAFIYFTQNCAAYGCMTFFTSSLKDQHFSTMTYGVLFAIPYALTALVMVLVSRHSDRTGERSGHVAVVYFISGATLILGVNLHRYFWPSYALIAIAITGPFAAMGPLWSIPGEVLPRAKLGLAMGLVNAIGNLGGFVGPYIAGWLKQEYHSLPVAFSALGAGMVVGAGLALRLPRHARG